MTAKKLSIRRSIERLLFPELERRGFQRIPPAQYDRLLPFGKFVRQGARGLDVLELQFDKYTATRFRLNLWVVPPGRTLEEPWRAGDPELSHYYFTRRGLVLRPWFGVRRRRPPPGVPEYDRAVNEVISLLPEVDDLFRSGRETRRMERMPERTYGIGRHRYPKGTWLLWSIPVALLMFIAGSVRWIAAHRPYEGSLISWIFVAAFLLAGWIWLWWGANRR